MSDAICALNTRTAYAERKYYNQGIEFKVNVKRAVLINGVPNNIVTRSDLIDRLVSFPFDYLGDKVRSDDALWRRFVGVAPRVFGALLDGLVGAMAIRRQHSGDNDKAAAALLG